MGVAYSAHTIYVHVVESASRWSIMLAAYSITEDSNTHDTFAVALSAPGVGVIGHVPREFLVWCDTFCCTDAYRRIRTIRP